MSDGAQMDIETWLLESAHVERNYKAPGTSQRAAAADLSQDDLRELFDYCPETGVLLWRARSAKWFNENGRASAETLARVWNDNYAGKPALNVLSNKGYRTGLLLKKHAKSHRVIWKLMTGENACQVDHINGDKSDNRWANLRNVTNAENAKNQSRRKNNKSGVTGVHWSARHGKWLVYIGDNGRRKNLGCFDCLIRAARVRKFAEAAAGFHENHDRPTGVTRSTACGRDADVMRLASPAERRAWRA